MNKFSYRAGTTGAIDSFNKIPKCIHILPSLVEDQQYSIRTVKQSPKCQHQLPCEE